MVSPGLVSATPWNHADPSHSTSFETASKREPDSCWVDHTEARQQHLGFEASQRPRSDTRID